MQLWQPLGRGKKDHWIHLVLHLELRYVQNMDLSGFNHYFCIVKLHLLQDVHVAVRVYQFIDGEISSF